jgi:hypothetical protein
MDNSIQLMRLLDGTKGVGMAVTDCVFIANIGADVNHMSTNAVLHIDNNRRLQKIFHLQQSGLVKEELHGSTSAVLQIKNCVYDSAILKLLQLHANWCDLPCFTDPPTDQPPHFPSASHHRRHCSGILG